MSLPCFNSAMMSPKDKIDQDTNSVEQTKTVEVFLKLFNAELYTDIKKRIDLTCQAALLEMQKTARVNKSKSIEKLLASKAKVSESMKDHNQALEKEKNQIMQDIHKESMKFNQKLKKSLEEFSASLNKEKLEKFPLN